METNVKEFIQRLPTELQKIFLRAMTKSLLLHYSPSQGEFRTRQLRNMNLKSASYYTEVSGISVLI